MKKILSLVLLLIVSQWTKANNVQISNIALGGKNVPQQYSLINFDIAWENSWRTSNSENNYDGVWVFIKYRKKNTSLWRHASINYVSPGDATSCGHIQASGSIIKTANDSKGFWQYRNADGIGDVSFTGNSVRWNYGADGIADIDSVEIKMFAVEVVYIPQGNYYLGDGGNANSYRFLQATTNLPYEVTSEGPITTANTVGNLWTSSSIAITAGSIPAAYPKGYNAFWIMKYEVSRQQYIDMVNTLSSVEANNLLSGLAGLALGNHPNYTTATPSRAIDIGNNVIGYLALLDWSAMRPFTELEFEKACRGVNNPPVANEYAWGNTTIVAINSPVNIGTDSEGFKGNANVINNYNVPVRVGALANDTSTRVSSGATYYGVMEMSGNSWEPVINVSNASGLGFTGNNGDGMLTPGTAVHNVANWPVPPSYIGLGARGGAYGQVSAAAIADYNSVSGRFSINSVGGYSCRGARTAE
jgi:formylglycine-generating enzyme required for sulfatase activity